MCGAVRDTGAGRSERPTASRSSAARKSACADWGNWSDRAGRATPRPLWPRSLVTFPEDAAPPGDDTGGGRRRIRTGEGNVPREFNVIALIKGEERYVYVY